MNTVDTTFRRNFIVASIMHVVLIGGIVVWEVFTPQHQDRVSIPLEIIRPAALLGDLPKGPGYGTGAYKAPAPTPPAARPAPEPGPSAATYTPDESPAPAPAPTPPKATVARTPTTNPNDVLIPKKGMPVKKVVEVAKPVAVAGKTTGKAPTPTTGAGKATTGRPGPSVDDFRARLNRALQSTGDGTAFGDNRPAGGGTGGKKYGRLGHPDGTVDGLPGGVGKGTPNWQYYLHVHDLMYDAWDQPPDLQNKLVATIVLRVARDGSVADVTLQRSSGDKTMDRSVLAAARKVPRLDPPPDILVKDSYATVSVNFRKEG